MYGDWQGIIAFCSYVEHQCNFTLNTMQVSGELDDRLESWDALRAALPVGTVSGAPKVNSCFQPSYMDILSNLTSIYFCQALL